jgi:predicted RNA-binding Zn-ribbon protein involved in translation (DUF1610 family)
MADFLAIGNEELEGQPEVKKGDMFDCPHCPDKHVIKCGKNAKTGEDDDLLLYYKCDKTGSAYLVGIRGKRVPFNKRGEN